MTRIQSPSSGKETDRIFPTTRAALQIENTPSEYLRIENLTHDLNLTAIDPENSKRWERAINTVTNPEANGIEGYIQALRAVGTVPTEKDIKALHTSIITSSVRQLIHYSTMENERLAQRALAYAFVLPRHEDFAFINKISGEKTNAFVKALSEYPEKMQAYAVERDLYKGLLDLQFPYSDVNTHVAQTLADVLLEKHKKSPTEHPSKSKLLDYIFSIRNDEIKQQTVATYLQKIIESEGYTPYLLDSSLRISTHYMRYKTKEAFFLLFTIKDIVLDSGDEDTYEAYTWILGKRAKDQRVDFLYAMKNLAKSRKKAEVLAAAHNIEFLYPSNQNPFYEKEYIRLMDSLVQQSSKFKQEQIASHFIPFLTDTHSVAVQKKARKYIIDAIKHEPKEMKAELIRKVLTSDILPVENLFEFSVFGLRDKEYDTRELTYFALKTAIRNMAMNGAFSPDPTLGFGSVIYREIEKLYKSNLLESYEAESIRRSMSIQPITIDVKANVKIGNHRVLFVREQ